MTDDLWYHALKFLDKYRTDVHKHDISELYQFADQTGVLDRHKQLLSQPFNENRVDMKIMYYELIKMLIDYERLNHPQTYDATKTVGKIEGYQELTNKLQRYLNQRFIGDIDELSKKQSKITDIFGGDSQNINLIQKIENLEQNHLTLQNYISKIEETNKKLVEDIEALKEKEAEISKNVTIIHEKHEEYESNTFSFNQEIKNTIGNSEEKLKSMEIFQNELNKKIENLENGDIALSDNCRGLKEQIEAIDKDARVFQNNLTNMFNQQKEEVEETAKAGISTISDDLIKVTEHGSDLEKQMAKVNEKIEELEQNIPNFSDEFVSKIDSKLTEFTANAEKKFEVTEENFEEVNTKLKQLINKADENKMELTKLSEVTATANDDLEALKSKTNENLQSVQNAIESQDKAIQEIKSEVDKNSSMQKESEASLKEKLDSFDLKIKEDIEILKNNVNDMSDNFEKAKEMIDENKTNITQLNAESLKHANIFDTIDTDPEAVKDKLRKAVDNIDSVNKTIQVFENRHAETSERMKELTLLTSNIESDVKIQEQKLEQEKTNFFNQYNGQIEELRAVQGSITSKIENMDADNNTLLEKFNGLEKNIHVRFQELDIADKQMFQKVEDITAAQNSRMNQMDIESKDHVDKLVKIEDAFQIQIQKNQYIDLIQSKLNQIEESKQLAEAKVRDEVDNTLKLNQSKIDTIQEDVLNQLDALKEGMQQNKDLLNDFKNSTNDFVQDMKLKDQQHHDDINKMKDESHVTLVKVNALQDEVNLYAKDQEQSLITLKDKVMTSLAENSEKVTEADAHVKNLRELNVKLLDQVKEKIGAHEVAQENTIENLRKDNDKLLSTFKEEVNNDMNQLVGKSTDIIEDLSALQKHVDSLVITIDEQRKEIDEVSNNLASTKQTIKEAKEETNSITDKVENIELKTAQVDKKCEDNKILIKETAHLIDETKDKQENELDKIRKQVGEIHNNFEEKSETIENLSLSVQNLETRYIETVEKIQQVDILVNEYEIKTKEMGLVFKDDQRKEMKSIENQLNTIYTEYEKIEKDMTDIKHEKSSKDKTLDDFLEKLNMDMEKKIEALSQQTNQQTELITKTDEKMSAIIEQASILMVNDVKQDETIISLDKSIKSLDSKLIDLESADLFLQESHRLLTEKTTLFETQSNKIDDIQLLLKTQQQEKIEENLSGKVFELVSTVGDIVTEQETLGMNVSSVKSALEGTEEKLYELEKKSPELHSFIREEVNNLEMRTNTEMSNVQENNERNKENILNIQNEINNTLGNLDELKKKMDENIQSTEHVYNNNIKSMEDEIKEVKGMLVSLQFQAEKAQYVETLASKVSQIDEDRQKREAEAKFEFEGLAQKNLEEINKLKTSLKESLDSLQDEVMKEKTFTKSEFEDMAHKIENMSDETKSHGLKLAELEPYAQGINTKVAELENNISQRIDLLVIKTEEHSSMIEKSSTALSTFSEKIITIEEKEKEIRENLVKTSHEDLNAFKLEIDSQVSTLATKVGSQEDMIETIDENISSLKKENQNRNAMIEKQQQDILNLNKEFERENELVVKRFSEQKNAIETMSLSLEQQFEKIDALQVQESKCFDGINQCKISITDIETKLSQMDQFGAEQTSLILAVEKTVTNKLGEVGEEVKENTKTITDELRNLRKDIATDKENLWTLVVEIYSSFRGYTLVVKSEGAVSEHQGDVLGVYRMVDSYNDRPVYKQEGGENYIYYSSASASWLVGTVVGHQYGWLRNGSTAASSARWLPDLSSGWEYRPLIRGEDSLASWHSDDGTLRIESLRDVEKVTEIIRDIKNAEEVD